MITTVNIHTLITAFINEAIVKNPIISATSYSPVAAESLPRLLFTSDKDLLSSCPILF